MYSAMTLRSLKSSEGSHRRSPSMTAALTETILGRRAANLWWPARGNCGMDKISASPEAALADLVDGASIAVSGFGTSYGFACSLLVAARDKGVKNLTLVSNGLGAVGQLRGMLLLASVQVSKLSVSFSSRPGMRTPADDLIEAVKLVGVHGPHRTRVERWRHGGRG